VNNYCIISNHKFAFCCIPKVANSSVRAALLMAQGEYDSPKFSHTHNALGVTSNRDVVAELDHSWTICAIVRNPFARLVSCYADKICSDKIYSQNFLQCGMEKNMKFKFFVERVCQNPYGNHHFSPQADVLYVGGRLLPHFVGRFESLEDDWEHIRSMTTLPLPRLPHLNACRYSKPYNEYFSPETVRMVEQTFARDLALFGYDY